MPACCSARGSGGIGRSLYSGGMGRSLYVVVLAALVGLAAAEDELASRVAVAIASTLLGSMIFQMGLFYLTNHSDEDMRRYSYEIINATVSIFAAVLLFQTFNDLVETYLLDGTSPEYQCLVDMGHMLVWYSILQLTLAWISGAIGGEPESMDTMELNMKTFAVLLAHMTGFASINAWGSIQQLEFFKLTPILSFLVLPISACGQFGLQRITDGIRYRVTMADDGEEDEFEKKWDEECEEAEDDVMGLTLSFNFTQAARFSINGFLPDSEGAELPDQLYNHSSNEIRLLFGVGFACAIIMVTLFLRKPSEEEEGSEHGHAEGKEEHGHGHAEGANHNEHGHAENSQHGHEEPAAHGHEEGETGSQEEKKGALSEELYERVMEVSIITTSMCFAWCTFFSTRMALASAPQLGLHDPMVLGIAVTLVISLTAFSSIRVLDMIADADWTDDRADDAIKQFIKAIGILVGFGWEQCFDQAVGSLASRAPNPHIAKMVLAIACVGVVVPAWKWFILPMAVQEGWKFGFVVDHDDEEKWNEVVKNLQEKWKKRKEEAGEECNEGYRLLGDSKEEPKELKNQEVAKVPTATEIQALRRAERAESALLATQAEAEALKEQIRGLSRQVWGNRAPGRDLSPSRSQASMTKSQNASSAVTPTGSTHSSMWNRAPVVEHSDRAGVAVDPV